MKKRRLVVPQPDWLCDVSGKTARVTSVGGRQLLIENFTGILEFTDTRILLGTRCGNLVVDGLNLSLREVRGGLLTVRGCIRNVQLPDAREVLRES